MKLRTTVIASSIILRIIATIPNGLLILIAGTCLVGCILESRSWTFWLLPIGFAAIHLLAIWLPGRLIGTALKMILRSIVTIVDCALIPIALFLFVALNMISSWGQLVFTFFFVLLLPVVFAVINILAIWIPVLVSLSTTPVEQNESKSAS
ncbi:MAG: hypothetical protein GWN67_25120 [Phycisphaerae bacterium]|nr:hypothetical protein [Phycisphaerae bacterium]NIP55417.1 hypothetical protein [Phycisphaerae bacterium]NIS54088.1 hypothetical protein [Phycisphaerae bacterium]NIU11730.1 hypothetical protein [Phycisphaerae bacterium]NIU59545.1 hypothetical protein [Phycisphaerae bacterium]